MLSGSVRYVIEFNKEKHTAQKNATRIVIDSLSPKEYVADTNIVDAIRKRTGSGCLGANAILSVSANPSLSLLAAAL